MNKVGVDMNGMGVERCGLNHVGNAGVFALLFHVALSIECRGPFSTIRENDIAEYFS